MVFKRRGSSEPSVSDSQGFDDRSTGGQQKYEKKRVTDMLTGNNKITRNNGYSGRKSLLLI